VSLTFAQATEAVYLRWKTEWTAAFPTIPFVFDNKKFVEPATLTPWCRVSLAYTDSTQHTLGVPQNRLYRREVAAWVRVYVPLDDGLARALGYADKAKDIFEGASFDEISGTGAAKIVPLGTDGRWYEVAVIIPLTYYELR